MGEFLTLDWQANLQSSFTALYYHQACSFGVHVMKTFCKYFLCEYTLISCVFEEYFDIVGFHTCEDGPYLHHSSQLNFITEL